MHIVSFSLVSENKIRLSGPCDRDVLNVVSSLMCGMAVSFCLY